MILQKLIINGFKSFVKKTTFEFPDSFTAIVGPNGGGKTNVVDALRWVMGEQSLKLIRCKKAEDVIFAGSHKLNRLGQAQVELYLNNADKRLDLDYPEVIISRRLARNGESEYFINKQKARLQDIILLLAKANFGQKTYGVIGQGMITDILSANPQDRKEFFDEATGVKEFQIKRDQALNKLIRTEDNLLHAEEILAELEPRLRSLSRQVSKLEKRRALEQELADKQQKYYGSLYKELADQLRLERQRQSEIQEQLQQYTEQYNSQQAELEAAQEIQSREEIFQKLQQQYQEISGQKNQLLKEQVLLKGELELEEKKQGNLDLVWMEKQETTLSHQLNSSAQEIQVLQNEVQKYENKLQTQLQEQTLNQENFQALEYQLLKAKEDLEKQKTILTVPEIRSQLEKLFSGQSEFLKELLQTDNLEKFKNLQITAKQITNELAELLDKLHTENTAEISAQKAQLESLQQKLQNALNAKEKLAGLINEARIALQIKKERINFLTEQRLKTAAEKENITAEIKTARQLWENTLGDKEKLQKWQAANKKLEQKIKEIESSLGEVEQKITKFNQEEEAKKNALFKLQQELKHLQLQINQSQTQAQQSAISIAKHETRFTDLEQEMMRELTPELLTVCREYKNSIADAANLRPEIENIKHQLELIGGIDPETIKEYQEVKERRDFLATQTKDLRKTIEALDELVEQLDGTIKKQFDQAFKEISEHFNRYFKVIFNGGQAKLSLITEKPQEDLPGTPPEQANNPIAPALAETILENQSRKRKKERVISGIEILASPPEKKVTNVHALSGGEKSMTAIALICAIISVNTPPFVILDEVEAALDETNAEKFAHILRDLSKKTQFIVITHNRMTMHQADTLYGVTMDFEGSSHILSVKLAEAEKMVQN